MREVNQRQAEMYKLSLGRNTGTSAHPQGPMSPAQAWARDQLDTKTGRSRLLPRTQTADNPPEEPEKTKLTIPTHCMSGPPPGFSQTTQSRQCPPPNPPHYHHTDWQSDEDPQEIPK